MTHAVKKTVARFLQGQAPLKRGRRCKQVTPSPDLSCFEDRRETSLNIFFTSRPTGNADPHRGATVPLCSSAPAGSIVLHIGDDAKSFFLTAETHDYLVEDNIIQDLESRPLKALGENAGQTAIAFDQFP